jgi:hypothetical protein
MNSILKGIILFATLSFIIVSCTKKINTKNCEPTVICTQEFRSVDVIVINNTMNALPLTITVTDLNANLTFKTVSTPTFNTTNSYTIFTDGDASQINQLNMDEPFRVDFLLGANVVKSEIYTFQKDCCHISKTNGLDTVTLN